MKKTTFKTLSILLAAVVLVAALPITAFAEAVNGTSSCQHTFEVTEYETYDECSNEYHKKILYRSRTCIWCGYEVIVEEDSYYEAHTPYDSYDEKYTFESRSKCRYTLYEIKTCIWCDFENTYEVYTYTKSHNTEEYYNTYYLSHSNEYHNTVGYLEDICLDCGEKINSYEEYNGLEYHEFDDSVDPEVDMEGVCILCGDEVSW